MSDIVEDLDKAVLAVSLFPQMAALIQVNHEGVVPIQVKPDIFQRAADEITRLYSDNDRLQARVAELEGIAKRWAAIDAGSWHPNRYASDKAELLADTRQALKGGA